MKKAGAAIVIVFIFLVPSASGPFAEDMSRYLERSLFEGDDYIPSDWQDSNSGNGEPLSGTLNGFKVSSGTSVIDYSHSGYVGIDPPLGWSSELLEGQLDHLSMWVEDVLVNPNLDTYTVECRFFTGSDDQYNSDPFFVPDSWTLTVNDAGPSGSQHPQHGYFEMDGVASVGYDGTFGWRFGANYGSGTVLDPSNGIYVSQLMPASWRAVYSAEISFLYYVSSVSVLDDNAYIFTNLEGYVSKHHVFDSGTTTDTWLQTTTTIPSSFFESMEISDALLFDIGVGTDFSGTPPAVDHEVFIDEIEVRLLVRPFPEQIDLRANGAIVSGSTQGSVSPYVPDGSNRDCYSAPNSNGGLGGVDLNGSTDNGWLDVGADVPAYPDWTTAYDYQVGLQFPLHVPQGSAITSATLQVETPSDSTGLPGMRIYVAAEDDVAAFTSGNPLLPDRYNWVNTSIYWRPSTWLANGRYDTPDIAALIQEVVSRPGWQSGNYICIMMDYSYSNQQYAYNQIKGSSGFAQADLARLFVDYIETAPSDTIPSFRFNKNIVIDHTKVVSNLQDFPVLVDIWDEDLHFNVQPDGDDIAFLYNDQVIPHELEVFDKKGNGTHAHLVCWVKVPQLSSVKDTTLVMVYGDEDLGSQENPDDVWNSEYSAVWHMNDNPAQPQWDSTYADYLPHQPQILDSTLPNLDGLTYGTMTSSDSVSGYFGNAIDLEGVNDFVDFGNPTELQMTGAFTVEAWFNADFIDNDYLVVKYGESNYRGWDISFDDDPSISPAGWVMFRYSPDGVSTDSVGYERIDTGQWYHVVGVFHPSLYARFYLNGELLGEVTTGIPASVNDPNRPVRIGRRSDNPGGTSYLDAIVDEVRISSVARSDAWIRTQYINQRNPELFLTVSEEGVNFQYMKDITIDHNKVASDLSGFPVLIDIYDSNLRTNVQPDGDDIMFTSNGISLSHEIELFDQQHNSTHAHLIAWVRADLSSASDTVLTMYYSNPSIGSQESPHEVWKNSYQGVWHLEEPSGNVQDSTSYDLDGTPLGGVTQGVIGKIGYASDFDGVDGHINYGDPVDGHLDFGANSFTISIWLWIDASTGTWQVPLNKGHPSALDSGYRFETNTDAGNIRFQISDGISYESSNAQNPTFGTWMHFVARVDRSGNEMHLFKDGSYSGFVDIASIGSVSSTDNLTLSRGLHLSTPVDGMLDEIRISNIARSDGWIVTEYNNQYDPHSFYSLGSELAPTIEFDYKKDIVVDNTKVDSDLSDFPLLIDIFDTDLKTKVQNDGDDIIFKSSETPLSYEIELFDQDHNSTHAHLVAWVKTDLSSTVDTTVTMHYGNAQAPNQEDPDGVWDDDFMGVWHLAETSGNAQDSTSYGTHGTPSGTVTQGASGQIGNAFYFDRDGVGTVNMGDPADGHLDFVDAEDFTIECWLYLDYFYYYDTFIISKRAGLSSSSQGYATLVMDDANGIAGYEISSNGPEFGVDGTTPLLSAGWRHVVFVFDEDSEAGSTIYIDGGDDKFTTSGDINGIDTFETNSNFRLNGRSSPTGDYMFDGMLDEVRISKVARSPDWILTEFNNQNDPASFYSVGEEIGPEEVEFQYSKDIVVDHTKVDSDLTDFPLLIDIYDTDLRTDVQADGDDIIFGIDSTALPHEVELFDQTYNSTHAHLVAWVKVDLSSSVDTTISMYYGNPSIGSQESPSDVWNSNYVAVWHMNQDPSSSMIMDSTINGYDLTATGFVSDQRIYDGKSGTAISVDGINDRFGISGISGPVNDFTFQSWFTLDNPFPSGSDMHFFRGNSLTNDYPLMRFATSSGLVVSHMEVTSDDDETITGSKDSWEADTWFKFAWVRNMSAVRAYHYLNGSLDAEDNSADNANPHLAWNQLVILSDFAGGNMWGPGAISEFRILNTALSPEWITAEYLNQNDPSSFYSIGAEIPIQPIEFTYKKDIVIDQNKVDADLTDFPLLINIYDTDLRTDVQSDGDDIIFGIDSTALPHEVELFDQTYNSTHAHLVAWVKTDLSSTADTIITMYYGNSETTSLENPSAVWSDNYRGVWHLGETSGDAIDSTSYGSNGPLQGGTTQGVNGWVDTAYDFGGSNGRVVVEDPADGHLDFGATDDFTISLWMYLDSAGNPEFLVAKRPGISGIDNGYTLGSDGGNQLVFEVADGSDEYMIWAATDISIPAWHYVTLVWDDDSASATTIYMNGADDKASTSGILSNIDGIETTLELTFGAHVAGIFASDGRLDEIRIASVARTAEWISTEYANQNDPASFYTVGPETIQQADIEFGYKKEISIDHTKVDADLTDFPLLIDIFDTDLKSKVQSDGDDIKFNAGGVTLPHEIEVFDQSYNGSHAHLVAWVKTDLSSSIDTTITMYYGNPNIGSQESAVDVWSSSYKGVWHLGENPTETLHDSSGNLNHGTGYNLQSDDQVDGQIDGSIEFDNVQDYIDCGNNTSLNVGSNDFALSLWFKYDGVDNGVLAGKGAVLMAKRYRISIDTVAGYLRAEIDDDTVAEYVYSTSTYGDNSWHHVSMVRDGNNLRLYIDGVEDPNSPTDITGYGSLDEVESFYINAFRSEVYGTLGYWSTANTDEVRVANMALTAGWIATEYSNQDDPASFFTIGPETNLQSEYQPVVHTSDFNFKKNLVVDHTKVGSDVIDFPVLLDIFDADLRTDVQSDGDDIMFKTGYTWCPHEITFFDQSYNDTHAHLIAWVKTDLSSSIDTTITMYYGNPDITSQESPSAVWGNYVGVWHLDESPAGTVYDSSPYNNDGVTLGSMSGSGLVLGQIGSGFELDGIDDMINVSESSSLDSIKYAGTLSLWLNWVDSSDGGYQRIMTTSDRFILNPSPPPTLLQDDGFEWSVQSDGDNYFYPWGGDSIDYNLATNPFTNDIWHHLVVTLDYSTKSVMIYLDGIPLVFAIENVPTQWTQLASLGDWLWGGNQLDAASHFQGRFDEIRVSNAAKSSGWILTEYNNQYNPGSFFSIGLEEQISDRGYLFTTNSNTSVTIGVELSLGIQTSTFSFANDFTLGTSFSIENGSQPIWTANVLISPPPELDAVSLKISYPEGEWWPFSVKTPSGVEKTFATDWTCFSGKLIVGSTAIDEHGMWKIQFLDRNHVLDMQMGPVGGPYSQTDEFTIGQNIEYRIQSSGTIGSTISLELINPSGSTWYTGSTSFQGERFALPFYNRKALAISHLDVAEDLDNFPVLVDIYDTDLRTDVRSDGRDIAFTIGEETLSHEIELFDQAFNLTHAHLIAWVKVPLLSCSSDTVISMYYGNPLAPIVYASGSVWDSDYVGVWHLGEIGTGLADEYTDSSLYKNHGQGGDGIVGYVPTRVVTPFGYGQTFSDHFIDCGNATSIDITGNQITLQLWMQYPSATHPSMGPFNHKGWYDGYRFIMSTNSQNMRVNLGPKPTGGTYDLSTSQTIVPNEWHHVVATYDGSLVKFYVDGNQDAATMEMTTNILSALPNPFRIGHGDHPEAKAWTYPWIGQIDEVRVSDVARSDAWIQTEFENQNDPSSFFSVGAEEAIGHSESTSINLDASAPAGVWHTTARYSDNSSDVNHRAGMFTRSFIVQRGTSLSLTAPGDAVADGISTKLVGEQLYVEFELEDTLNAALVSGATVSMNWSVSGVPTDVQLNDYGDGRYGKTLNTSDLDSYGRWRIDLETSHPFYTNATDFFYLDLSHRTFLTYEPPPDVPYGDNFEVKLILKDKFDNAPLTGATITCNATIFGSPVDYGNGTYLVTIDSTGFSTGAHTFRLTATPSSSYLLSSSIDIQFNCRPIATEVTPLSSDTVEAPWGQQANTSIYWSDVDHTGIGVDGGTLSISPFVQTQTTDDGGGYYSLTIDVSSLTPGTYFFNLTFSKLNYQSSMSTISVTVLAHRTTPSVDYNSTIPVGTDTYFDVSWLDLEFDSVVIGSGNLSQVNLDWGTGSDSFPGFGFWLDTSGWAVGSYTINVTISATGAPRFYMDSYIEIQLEIRKLNVYLSWNPLEPFPNGNDFVMFIYVNVSEPGSPIDGTPITGLDQSYFSASNETGSPYTFESFTNLGSGVYQITIDSSRFLEGQYKIIIFVDFLLVENYTDSNTPEVSFSYRPILTYLSSPDYPTVTTSFDTNVTITLSYVDIDHIQNITIGTITSEGASIVWQHIADGVYEVLIIVQGWDLGAHEVNLTADASGYQAKTLTFQILVQIAYAYARSSVSIIDLLVGDTAVFYADYWDITHDEPILGATINHNWTYSLSISWTGDQYRIELPSIDTDRLGSYLVIFNFSKGPNYQFGYFNLSIILRTHLTEFRLASAIEPTSYNAMVNISVYCGDLDNDVGIAEAPISLSVYGDSGLIASTYENDSVLGDGYYIIRFAATNLGSSGIYDLTVYFNWTGPVQKYYNGSVAAFVRIIGEASDLELIDSAEPTPYLGKLSYTYVYSELYSGNGISNVSAPVGNVFIYVEFVGQSFSPSLFTITEDIGNPGYYTVEFNSTIFAGPGVYTMIVFVNWTKTQEPFYGNWTDTVSVRIIPRSTLINLIPPESTPYGVNATFSFSFDDVADSSPYSVANSSQMTVSIGLPDYTITYNISTRQFLVSFNTSILGAPLGNRQVTISVSWIGAPYYANVTGRTVIISIRFRETELDYSTISPTPYGDNVTLHFTFTDVTLGMSQAINDGLVTLYNDSQEIPVFEYTFTPLGNGEYEIELKTSYFTKPGIYTITVEMSTSHFYYAVVTTSRTLSIRYRLTVLLVEPIAETQYNESLEVVFHYNDVLTLAEIGNSSTPTSIQILNGSSWLFTSIWRGGSEDYLLTIQTHNQVLEINKEYVLWIEVSYPDSTPFYLSADTFVSFTLRERSTNLELTASPEPTQYLENINFTVYYQDSFSMNGIAAATITLTVGGSDLVEGVDYLLQSPTAGNYFISLNTTALGPAGTTANLQLRASWTSTAPYYSTSKLSLTLSVTQRNSITEIISSTTQVRFLENVTFTIRYSDGISGQAIQLTKNQLLIYSEGTLLLSDDFSMNYIGSSHEISINSSVLSVGLISNWNITFYLDWQNNVAPYYADGQASLWVSVVNRVGIVIRDAAPTVPIHDNMTLKFTYIDDTTGAGINDAIVIFDCLSPSGLVEGTDFWIFRNAGSYSILVDTTSLGGTGTFTFSLRLLWNPMLVPFYRNTTTTFLQGTVRLIRAQLTNEEPNPSTVPINDNVSVILTLEDLDHAIPIIGAESSFSVIYKTNASGPATWSITPISPGIYELVVDCSDAGAIGTNALIITLSFSDYQTVEVQVPFQIRPRQGELNELTPPSAFYGETTYVIVELVDTDAGNAPISDAILTITWPDIGYTPDYTSLGNGQYNITLTTDSLDAGLYTLVVGAQKSDYFISDISVPIQILSIPTELILPQTIPDVYWGEDVSIWAIFNDTRDNILISGANLVYQFGVLGGTLIEGAPAGNYSFTVDTGDLAVATTYVVSITATLINYVTVTSQITVNVLKLPVGLIVVSEAQPEIFKGTPVNITVYVNNTYSNTPLLGATVEVSWIALGPYSILLSPVPGMDGYYSGFVDTNDLYVGEYIFTITAGRTNYVTVTTSASVKIKQISTSVMLDALTSTYSSQTFNWSDTIRIGVYVLAPSLNESYPLSTGLANCTVQWSLSGTVFTGEFLNGTLIGGSGYFYFDFETWDYDASTYTLRITAYPNIGMFAFSSNLTTLIIEPIETSVESTYLSPKIWGWTGWINLTYWDLLFDRGIAGANIIVDWAGIESTFQHVGNGTYQVFINASRVEPGIYPVSVRFVLDNYKTGTGVFTLIVREVPTAISVFAPALNQLDDDSLNLEVPYGDVLPLVMFYNDTWYNRGIPGATEITGVVIGPGIPDTDYLLIEELSYGNYSVLFDTTQWTVSENPYRVILNFYLGNWSRATIELQITIINVPTSLQVEGDYALTMSYGQEYSVWVFYYDSWIGHAGEGIAGGSMNATSLDLQYVIVSLNQSDPSRPGWYEIRLRSGRTQGSTIVSIILSRENYESASVSIAVSVEPSEFDLLLERAIIFGTPIGLVLLAGAILWTRLFSVPKRLREIKGMVKTISKGKIPETPDNVPSRQDIVADLFNDFAEPIGITKTPSSMPSEAIPTDVPEIEELLVQLSILSKLTTDELEDFKLDVSKMKLSEQVAFVKEVINQESIKQGRIEGKPMELILEETAAKARAILAGEEIEGVTKLEPVEVPKKPDELKPTDSARIDFEEVGSTDLLSKSELKEIRKKLKNAGIKGTELDTIMDQTRELPRELAEELLKIILQKRGEEK